jgi:hypothetical protein
MRIQRITTVALVACIALGLQPAWAQWVVNDPSTTARNTVTAVLKISLLQTLNLERERLRRMARRLSEFTNLGKFAAPDPPRWRTHGSEDFLFSEAYNEALSFGDPQGRAYLAVSRPVADPRDALSQLSPNARRALLAQLATLDAADATAIAGTHQTGQLRFNGRKHELPAIDALEAHVIDPSREQSTTAVLDKISGAVLIEARQKQARIQLLAAVAEQLIVENKRSRDAEAAAMNMQLNRLRDGRAANTSLLSGAGADLRGWRRP